MDMDTRDELTRLLYRFEQAQGLLCAVCEAMERNAWSSGAYAPALYGVHEYLSGLVGELRRSVEPEEIGGSL